MAELSSSTVWGDLIVTHDTEVDGQLTINQATGTAPITVESTTKVDNLNVDKIDGCDVNDSGAGNTDLWSAQKVIWYLGSHGTTGYTGSQGTIGYSGSLGYSGSKGDIGYTGSASTVIGYTGSKGDQGIIGYTGSKGDQGVIGYSGSRGYTGSASTVIGYTGSKGPIGYTGSASTVIGYTGSRGPIGYTGSKGTTGDQGVIGYTGSKGDIGYTGSASTVIGYTGSQGIQGNIGYAGSKGDQGNIGYTGSASTVIGYTGSKGNIGYTGSASTVIGYTGSQGPIGYAGSKGITGDQGVIGYTGSQGPIGYTGSKGDQGIQGNIGYTGSKGDIGYVGSASTVQGPIGYTGSQGPIGYTGSKGYTGSQGPIGYSGSASTVIGYTGSKGDQGNIGYTGSKGDQGVIGYTGSASTVIGYTGSKGAIGYTGSGNTNADTLDGYHGSYYLNNGDVVMNTNPFGGRKLYISSLDNALYAADKKWIVTVTRHLVEYESETYPKLNPNWYSIYTYTVDGNNYTIQEPAIPPNVVIYDGNTLKTVTTHYTYNSSTGVVTLLFTPVGTIYIYPDHDTPEYLDSPVYDTNSATALFDGSYEGGITVAYGYYAKIRITPYSSGHTVFGGYPYGTLYASYYHTGTPDKTEYRTYNYAYRPQTIGWKHSIFSDFTGTTSSSSYIARCDDDVNYGRTIMEILVYGHDTTEGANITQISELDWKLSRPDLSSSGSTVTKYGTNKLYYNLTFGDQTTNKLTLSANGVITSAVATGTAPFTVASTTKVANLNVDMVDDCSVNDAGVDTASLWTAQKVIHYLGSHGTTGYTGSQGTQGDLGYTGSKGTDGVIGYNGSTGYTGSMGYTGSASTVIGYTGSRGATGYTGSASTVIGYTGSQGTQGNIGYTGSASTVIGYTGSRGATGYTGSASTVIGYTGSRGYTGSASTVIGYTGSKGVQGNLGYTGSASTVIGYTGSRGYTGSASTVIGYTGSQGPIGYTGSASTVIGYTGSRGAQGNIGYTGSASTVIGYTGSRGATGYTGSASTVIGYTGSQGPQGNIGYTGSASTAVGYTGSQGIIGYTGSAASALGYMMYEEEFEATAGQTVFNLTSSTYQYDSNAVEVFIWGARQPQDAFTEDAGGAKITMKDGMTLGDKILVKYYHAIVDLKGEPGYTGSQGTFISTTTSDLFITTTSETTIATRTPDTQKNCLVWIYFRVINATTNVTVKVTYTDGSGAQSNTLIDAQVCPVGSYSMFPLMINATAAAIAATITCNAASRVYASAAITEVE